MPLSLEAEAVLCSRTQHEQDRHARHCSLCRSRRAHHAQKDRVGTWEIPRLAASKGSWRSASGRRRAEADDARRREVGRGHSSDEAGEQSGAIRYGVGGAKGRGQGECGPAKHVPGTEPGKRVTGAGAHTASSPSSTRGGSRMRESRTYGSVRGALSNERPYRDRRFAPRKDRNYCEFRSTASKLNRSRKFLRCSRMLIRNARSVALVIIGSIRSSWFIATSCRTSLRILPMASRGNACTTWICSGGFGPFAAVSASRSSASSAVWSASTKA